MISARDVPNLVALHQDYLRGTDYQRFAARYLRSAWVKSNRRFQDIAGEAGFDLDKATFELGSEWCEDEHNLLNIARLFHVSESMTEVAKHAARQLDDSDCWTLEAIPCPAGLLVFEKPLRVEDVWGRVLAFSAVTWHWRDGFYGPAPGRGSGRAIERAIQFNFYTDTTEPGDDYTVEIAKLRADAPDQWGSPGGRWELAHMAAHFQGSRIGPFDLSAVDDDLYTEWRERYLKTHPDDLGLALDKAAITPEIEQEAMGEYVVQTVNIPRILYAIFALMEQTITELDEYTDKKLARRYRNKRKPPPMVTIIRLRHAKAHGYREEGTGTWLTYRSVTCGHWRWQPYGPGRTQVKRIWINPYTRGPENAPFHQPKRISTLVR